MAQTSPTERTAESPAVTLGRLITTERERIARLWAKRLRDELHELDASGSDLREPLLELVTELGRLLTDRAEEGVYLWPEVLRSHGVKRYELSFSVEDLVREQKVLHEVLLRVVGRRHGTVAPQTAELLAELLGEGTAAVCASHSAVARTEQASVREATLMESLLHHIDVGILLCEADGRISYATPPITKLTGLPPRSFMHLHTEGLRAVLVRLNARHEDGSALHLSELPLLRALKTRREVRGQTMVIDHFPDGRETILEVDAVPFWEEGTLVGVVQTIVDRTDTTQKARELSQAYEHLRSLQARLLQRTRTQALSQLASGTAHALNNFLNVIRLRLTLIRREVKPEHAEALDRTLGKVSDLVSRLQDFVEGRSEDELQTTKPAALLEEALELAKPELERPDAPVDVRVRALSDGACKVDVSATRELLVNLVLAARARMPEGGVLLIDVEEREGWLELSLSDEGPPLTPEECTRLFDPLKAKTATPHLALLLAMGRSQVQRWGGELWCELGGEGDAAPTRGALKLKLPLVVAQEQEKKPPAPRPAPAPGPRRQRPRRVLVVDDDADNARMLADVLAEEGYAVQVANSAEEAIAAWEGQPFDAALLDAVMPDASGWSVARKIREHSPRALLAVVTGGDVRGQNRESLAQVDAVFQKPVDVSALDEFLARPEPLPGEPSLAAEGPIEVPPTRH